MVDFLNHRGFAIWRSEYIRFLTRGEIGYKELRA